MRVIVHLSDLHFGRTDPRLVSGVRSAIEHIAPDLVAVSGDLHAARQALAVPPGQTIPRLTSVPATGRARQSRRAAL